MNPSECISWNNEIHSIKSAPAECLVVPVHHPLYQERERENMNLVVTARPVNPPSPPAGGRRINFRESRIHFVVFCIWE